MLYTIVKLYTIVYNCIQLYANCRIVYNVFSWSQTTNQVPIAVEGIYCNITILSPDSPNRGLKTKVFKLAISK